MGLPDSALESSGKFTDSGSCGRFEIQPFFQQYVRGQRAAQLWAEAWRRLQQIAVAIRDYTVLSRDVRQNSERVRTR